MSLQNKTLLITGVSLVSLFLVLMVPGGMIIWHGFSRLEEEMVIDHMDRARAVLDEQLAVMIRTVGDWSNWDDTWHFVSDANPEYREANLDDESLETLGLDLMMFVNRSGRLVFGKAVGPVAGEGDSFPECLRPALLHRELLFSNDPLEPPRSGLLQLADGAMFVAAAPILRNNHEGPVRGTLIVGKWLDDAETNRLSRMAHLSLEFLPLNGRKPTAEQIALLADAIGTGEPFVRVLDDNCVAGCFPLPDLHGKPVLLGIVRVPRDVMAQGRASLIYSAAFFLIASVCFSALVWYFVNRLVLSRLLRLAGDVKKSAERGYPMPNIHVSGSDELTDLGLAINGMLRQIRSSIHQLRKKKVEAQQASRAKSEFLANMSHEIRTPLTAVLGFADVLLDQVSEPEKVSAAETIKRNGQYLLDLINDILDLSKVESGKMQVECVACSPCRLVSEVASLMRVRAAEKNLLLTVEFAGPLPSIIHTDVTRLRQILINLLGNAIKFTEAGSVQLRARLLQSGDAPTQMSFDVIDTGIGIDEDQLARLFAPFSQADGSTTRRFGGSGLGLAISRRLARKLGGDITITTQPGSGSTFSLTVATGSLDGVPMLDNPSENLGLADAGAPTPPAGIRLDGRILLAEDGPDNQRLISFLLRKAGAEVTVAENGQLACQKALACHARHDALDGDENNSEGGENAPFDVILMDMQMPVLDGYEAARRLRKAGYAGPIIALTAHAMKQDRQKCLDAGCDEYLAKPIDRHALLTTVAEYLRKRTPDGEPATGYEGGSPAASPRLVKQS